MPRSTVSRRSKKKAERALFAAGKPTVTPTHEKEVAAPAASGARAWTLSRVAATLTPSRLTSIFTAADGGDNQELLSLAAEVEQRDAHAGAQLRTRKLALVGCPWLVEATSDKPADVTLAAELQALVESPAWFGLALDLLDALMKGYSVCEIVWATNAKRWTPARFIHRDPRHFSISAEDGNTLRLRTEAAPKEGEDLQPYKWVVHTPRLSSGPLVRAGLVRALAPMYVLKGLGVAAWGRFIEVFGVPMRVGSYAPGAAEEEIEALAKAVRAIGHDAAGIKPNTTDIAFLDAAQGDAAAHERLALWVDSQISKAVLGQTMTADAGSSRSQAEVHDAVRRDILLADARALVATLQRDVINAYVDLNTGPPANGVYPRLRCITDVAEDRKAFVDALVPMIDRGLEVEQSVVRDKLGLPAPDKGATKLMTPVSRNGTIQQAAKLARDDARLSRLELAQLERSRSGQFAEQAAASDFIDELTNEVDHEAVASPFLDAITEAARGADNFDEFRARLTDLEVDATAMVESLALRCLLARGAGDATDEVNL